MGERGRRGTVQRFRAGGRRTSKGSPGQRHERDPHYVLAETLTEALDPTRAPGKVREMAEIDEKTMAELRKRYERPPTKPKGGTP